MGLQNQIKGVGGDTWKGDIPLWGVDDMVMGCPMDEDKFLVTLDKYLVEFGVKSK